MPQQSNRTARVEARISPDALAIVKRAAEIQGRSISEFIVDAAREAAHRTIQETTIIHLSIEDQRRIIEAIRSEQPTLTLINRCGEQSLKQSVATLFESRASMPCTPSGGRRAYQRPGGTRSAALLHHTSCRSSPNERTTGV